MLKPIACVLTSMVLAAAHAQQPGTPPAYREFAQVRTLRVVCEHEHFGRVLDLIADVPSGRLVAAVISMPGEHGDQTVAMPFERIRYDVQSSVLHVGPCLDDQEPYPPFDASKVRITRTVDKTGDEIATGTVLLSRLTAAAVQLEGDTTGSCQGATIELTSGNVAFLDVAAGGERAGDGELHPAPWSALRWLLPAAKAQPSAPILGLAMDRKALQATPSLVEVILQDALYRPRVYRAFAVPPPPYDPQ